MNIEQSIVTVTTGTGTGTGYTEVISGVVLQIRYVKHGTAPYSNGVDFAVTAETSGVNIWTEENVNASKTVLPRQATHTTAGVAAVYGTDPVLEPVYLHKERISIAVSSGGNNTIGTFYVTVQGILHE